MSRPVYPTKQSRARTQRKLLLGLGLFVALLVGLGVLYRRLTGRLFVPRFGDAAPAAPSLDGGGFSPLP